MNELSLRQTRLIKEISKEAISEAIDVHVNTYTAYEEHPEKVPMGKAIKICQYLGVPLDSFIFWSGVLQNVE